MDFWSVKKISLVLPKKLAFEGENKHPPGQIFISMILIIYKTN